jgi:streptomycin 6-kinase
VTDGHASLKIPAGLIQTCHRSSEGRAWLERLPGALRELQQGWSLTLGDPFDGPEVSASWVAPVRRSNGTSAVLKVAMPHMEAEHEIDGLRFWDGDPTVHLLEADDDLGAMLLERCEPGTWLRSRPEDEQDVVVAGLLRRMWRVPPEPHPFRPLTEMVDVWVAEAEANEARWPDPGLLRDGLSLFRELPHGYAGGVLLATDLHAGNVLRATREPWLVIDPKPFVGDPAYDATQHLLNCWERLLDRPRETIARFAGLLEVDGERVRRWLFGRVAAAHHEDWGPDWFELARALGRGD